jgi:hypothetical protein
MIKVKSNDYFQFPILLNMKKYVLNEDSKNNENLDETNNTSKVSNNENNNNNNNNKMDIDKENTENKENSLEIKKNSPEKNPHENSPENKENSTEKNIPNNDEYEYILTGIVVHFGTSESGHYYDYICNAKNNIWYEFNDKNIKQVNLNEVKEESFGSHDLYDDSKNDNNTSAYILFYTNKNFWEIHQKNYENLNKFHFESEIAFPPYNKFSNINKKLLNIINFDMFKYWSIKLITQNFYQKFIYNFIKLNLQKEIFNLEQILNNLLIIEQKKNINNDEEEKEIENLKLIKIEKKNNNNNEKITILFKFLLRYVFNIIFRLKNKNFLSNFLNLFKIFINFDSKFALFFIEEFSLNDTINEFLIFCPNKNLTSISVDLIIYSLFKIKNDNNNNNNFILKFLNNILYQINALIFDYDCQILFELILKIILI